MYVCVCLSTYVCMYESYDAGKTCIYVCVCMCMYDSYDAGKTDATACPRDGESMMVLVPVGCMTEGGEVTKCTIHVCVHVCMHILRTERRVYFICMYVDIFYTIYIYTHTHTHTHIYIYIYTHTHMQK